MMTRMQYLLGKVAEEAAEVAQRALKAQEFGMREVQPGQPLNNAERLQYEVNDLVGVLRMAFDEFSSPEDFLFLFDPDLQFLKMQKVEKFMQYSRELGEVE